MRVRKEQVFHGLLFGGIRGSDWAGNPGRCVCLVLGAGAARRTGDFKASRRSSRWGNAQTRLSVTPLLRPAQSGSLLVSVPGNTASLPAALVLAMQTSTCRTATSLRSRSTAQTTPEAMPTHQHHTALRRKPSGNTRGNFAPEVLCYNRCGLEAVQFGL